MTDEVNVKITSIEGVLLIEKPVYYDERGFFHEVFRLSELENFGIHFNAVQWNHSVSKPNVIRAIHTEDWQKIVYPLTGHVFIAIADVREKSKEFGKVETFTFDCTKEKPKRSALFLPPGVGNSICALDSGEVNYMYLVEEYWDNSKASGIAWDDPDLNIKWPIKNPIISDRDRKNPTLRETFPHKFK